MGIKPTAADYKNTLKSLLPRGKAWNFVSGSNFFKILFSFAEEMARVSNRGFSLIEECDPRTSTELLPDWERLLGLPDDCQGGLSDTITARRQDVTTRLTLTGGSSIEYYKNLAQSRGFNVNFVEEKLSQCWYTKSGDACNGIDDWAHVLTMLIDNADIINFQAGISAAGESLGSFDNSRIECLINSVKPAHVYLFTAFQDSFALCGSAECGDPIREIY